MPIRKPDLTVTLVYRCVKNVIMDMTKLAIKGLQWAKALDVITNRTARITLISTNRQNWQYIKKCENFKVDILAETVANL